MTEYRLSRFVSLMRQLSFLRLGEVLDLAGIIVTVYLSYQSYIHMAKNNQINIDTSLFANLVV